MLKYKVSVSYYDFIFDSRNEAMNFAEMAKAHYSDEKRDNDINVSVEIIKVETNEANEADEVEDDNKEE